MTMTSAERFLAAVRNEVPDRIPVAPDISNYIPCKQTGLPFWEIYFENRVPLWQAYLDAADYYGIDAWMASCTGAPLKYPEDRLEWESTTEYRKDMDAMIRKTTVQTPDGPLTAEDTCFRADPPSPTEKFIKDFARDWPRYRWLFREPCGIDVEKIEQMRAACRRREQAFGVCIGYPGFQVWYGAVQDGVAALTYAEVDTPEILQEWFECDLEIGTHAMELIISVKPDYILLGGSGTITLASPALARKYAIPALKKLSAMAKAAGVPTMLHSCGKARALVDMLCEETDVNSINPLEIPPMGDCDLAEIKRTRGRQISLMGNLHTTDVMLRGSPATVRQAALAAMRDAGPGGGFILSTGDQCPRDTPEENLFTLVETARRYGVYDRTTGRLLMQ